MKGRVSLTTIVLTLVIMMMVTGQAMAFVNGLLVLGWEMAQSNKTTPLPSYSAAFNPEINLQLFGKDLPFQYKTVRGDGSLETYFEWLDSSDSGTNLGGNAQPFNVVVAVPRLPNAYLIVDPNPDQQRGQDVERIVISSAERTFNPEGIMMVAPRINKYVPRQFQIAVPIYKFRSGIHSILMTAVWKEKKNLTGLGAPLSWLGAHKTVEMPGQSYPIKFVVLDPKLYEAAKRDPVVQAALQYTYGLQGGPAKASTSYQPEIPAEMAQAIKSGELNNFAQEGGSVSEEMLLADLAKLAEKRQGKCDDEDEKKPEPKRRKAEARSESQSTDRAYEPETKSRPTPRQPVYTPRPEPKPVAEATPGAVRFRVNDYFGKEGDMLPLSQGSFTVVFEGDAGICVRVTRPASQYELSHAQDLGLNFIEINGVTRVVVSYECVEDSTSERTLERNSFIPGNYDVEAWGRTESGREGPVSTFRLQVQ